jgi:putative nucleotidyltransferase with HDIG domain
MKPEITFLHSKVARRIFFLFLGCALLPVIALTLVSFYQVSGQLRKDSRRQLAQAAKFQGMAIYERLRLLDTEIQMASLRIRAGQSPDLAKDFSTHFLDTASVRGPALAAMDQPSDSFGYTSAEVRHLFAGNTLLRVQPCPHGAGNCVAMFRLIGSGRTGSTILFADINPDYLWPGDTLPISLETCVFTSGRAMLFCPGDQASSYPTVSSAQPQSAKGFFSWKDQQTAYDAAYWSLLLRPKFAAGSWVVVVSEKQQDALAPMDHFRKTFPLFILLALWVVMLVSLIQIRRTLVPLERLKEGTRQIGEQHFSSRVEVRSGDEFETLATSFNSMATRLGKQFHALETIHEIDQAILASLNREGIVEAVLGRMPYLLSWDCFALALFPSAASSSTVIRLAAKAASGEMQSQVRTTTVGNGDLQQLQQNPDVLHLSSEVEPLPDFVLPLKNDGFSQFLILPIFVEHKVFGALICAHRGAPEADHDDTRRARQVADQLAVAFSNVELIEALQQLHLGTLTALARAIDAKSDWTGGHSERVTNLSLKIGRAMGLSPKDLAIMHRGGLLHDIGKIGTPPTILDKPDKLDAEEMRIMRDHVRIGLRILEPIPGFQEALPIVAQHHEWFNGGGYPEGLAGEQISLHARIFAVADCYDAMISDRPYRKGLPKERALDILRQKSGTQYDPKVLDVFFRLCAHGDVLQQDLEQDLEYAASATN